MPYALVIIGLLMIITGINNTYSQFASQIQSDFGGSKGFIVWAVALAAVGALGYIKDLRQFSHYFMALILISFVLSNKGVFQNFTAALAAGPAEPTASPEPGSAVQPAITAQSSTADINSAISSNKSGLFGQAPQNAAQAKFNGWMNYLLGLGTNTSGSAQQ